MISSVVVVEILSRLIGVLRSLINPKVLGAEQYGRLGLVTAILLFATFCDLGINREFELKFPHSHDPRRAVKDALGRFMIRAVAPSLVLSAIIARSQGMDVAVACLPYVIFFGVSEVFLIVHRASRNYWALNAYTLGNSLLLLGSAYWIAPRFGLLGLLVFQSGTVILSVIGLAGAFLLSSGRVSSVSAHASPETPTADPLVTAGESARGRGAHWLFLGQLVQISWLVADRWYLSGRISGEEMGFWTLGSLPGTLLVGVTNTIGAIHIASWVKKERPFSIWLESAAFFGAWAVGTALYAPFVRIFLPSYAPGILWNVRLIILQGSLAILFFYDGYRRSQIQNARGAADWFWVRAGASVLGLAAVFGVPLLLPQADPKALVLAGFHALLFGVWVWEKRFGLAGMQVGLAVLSWVI